SSRILSSRLRRACLIFSIMAFAAPVSAAELTPDMSAEQVAAESYARMRAGAWDAAAETFDPAALKHFREMVGPIIEGPLGEGMIGMFFGTGKTADDIRKMNDMAVSCAMWSATPAHAWRRRRSWAACPKARTG